MKKSSLLILRGLLTGSLVLTELINELSFLKRKLANIIPRIFPNKDASITKYKKFKWKKVYLLEIRIDLQLWDKYEKTYDCNKAYPKNYIRIFTVWKF